MSNKILIYTDNHFCTNSSIVRKRGKKYSLRLENQLKTMNWLIQTAKENDCGTLICLGDFFDSSSLSSEEIACLSELNFEGLDAHFIVGNHEMGSSSLEFSSAHSFLINQSCTVYTKPSIIGMGNTLLYILPYQLESCRLNSVMDYFPNINAPEMKYKVLLTHNDISGVQMGKFISKEGFKKEDLSCNFNLVLNGHLHNRNWVSENILNVGNITGQNFTEDAFNYGHYCEILDCDNHSLTHILNPHAFNFYKLDFTGKNNNIDYINRVCAQLDNAIISAKVYEKDIEYMRNRLDPEFAISDIVEKNPNVIQCRFIIERTTDDCQSVDSITTLQLNHLQEFQEYILQTMGNSSDIITELQEVLR